MYGYCDALAGEDKPRISFKRCLVLKCQEEFERADRYDATQVLLLLLYTALMMG